LICRNVSPFVSAACASPMMPSECGTPPEIVHRTPVPHHVMHSSTLRRLTPFLSSNPLIANLLFSRLSPTRFGYAAVEGETLKKGALFPDSVTIWRAEVTKIPVGRRPQRVQSLARKWPNGIA